MSLYNALFGVNSMAGLVLQALGIESADVPRFRDAWLTEDGKLAIYTRTGGGNRGMYEDERSARLYYPEYFDEDTPPSGPWNADLRKLAGFEYDEDDDFDNTYATFYFTPAPEWVSIFDALKSINGTPGDPRARWERLLEDLRASGEPTTEAGKRALVVGRQIFEQLVEDLP